ncbi:galactose mutarotase-like [Styela clava]
MATQISTSHFGITLDGSKKATKYILKSSTVELSLTDYGATITSIKFADKNGVVDDVVTGYDDVQGYEKYSRYFGCSVGRVCNRIANGKFTLNGTDYSLPINNPPNSLHGGIVGFDKKIWEAEIQKSAVVFKLVSRDGEEGFPGTVHATARYELNESELLLQYTATTDKFTIVNMTNHSYFNLAGHEKWNKIYDHKVMINADQMTPFTESSIPTGEIKDVEGTIFDLRKPELMTQERLDKVPNGYDNNFCLSRNGERRLAARVEQGPSGRVMEVETTQPGIQFYTANFLSNEPKRNGQGTYGKQSCLCLETQNYPDAINHIGKFPNAILKPGEVYDQKTWYTFTTVQ